MGKVTCRDCHKTWESAQDYLKDPNKCGLELCPHLAKNIDLRRKNMKPSEPSGNLVEVKRNRVAVETITDTVKSKIDHTKEAHMYLDVPKVLHIKITYDRNKKWTQ